MNVKNTFIFTAFALLLLLFSCKPTMQQDVKTIPTRTEKGFHALIEIPAGTNHKIEYKGEKFQNDQLNNEDRVIDFLPYPGNYGFIPGTLMEEASGGDGDALDVLVIAESVPTGTLMEIKPIAALVLKDRGELDTKIIAVPVDSSLQIMAVENFTHFITRYSMAQTILKDWFLNYKGLGKVEFVSWQNERFAEEAIKKWSE